MAQRYDPTMGGIFIRDARHGRGLTQQQLGDMIGSSSEKISKIETGHRKIQFEDMRALAYALQVDVGSLALAAAGIHPAAYLTYIFLTMAEQQSEIVEAYKGFTNLSQ